jgi:uncharacterized protein
MASAPSPPSDRTTDATGHAFGRPRTRRWLLWLGLILAGLSALLALSLMTALPPVLDMRPWLLATATMTGTLLVLASRRATRAAGSALMRAIAVLSLVAAALAFYDMTLAYRTEEVSFASGDVTLRGTLYLPRTAGRHPTVVLIHGAGVQTRDEYRFYARQYVRRGLAALAYDKRGSGASTGSVATATYQMLVGDAARATEFLRRHPRVDPERIGIFALSEGEWVGPLTAQQANPAFLVLISASAMTPAEQVRYETAANVRRAGFGEAEARQAADLYALVSHFERTGQGREELNRQLQAASAEPWFAAARYLEAAVPEYDRVLALSWFPAWRSRMDFDALPILSTLKCPVLAQVGGADPKNDGEAAIERIRMALASGGNTRFTGVVYPNATHNVIEWRLPGGLPPPFFAREYLDTQLDWVARQVGLRGPVIN